MFDVSDEETSDFSKFRPKGEFIRFLDDKPPSFVWLTIKFRKLELQSSGHSLDFSALQHSFEKTKLADQIFKITKTKEDAMFELDENEGPAYWCVVFLVNTTKEYGNYFIVEQSQECLDGDILPDGAYDESLGSAWIKDNKPGLYHLTLRPWSSGPDEYDCGVDVVETKCLYVYDTHYEKG